MLPPGHYSASGGHRLHLIFSGSLKSVGKNPFGHSHLLFFGEGYKSPLHSRHFPAKFSLFSCFFKHFRQLSVVFSHKIQSN